MDLGLQTFNTLKEIALQFNIVGEIEHINPYGSGRVHSSNLPKKLEERCIDLQTIVQNITQEYRLAMPINN